MWEEANIISLSDKYSATLPVKGVNMNMKLNVFVVLVLGLAIMANAFHVHPHIVKKLDDSEEMEKIEEDAAKDTDGIDIVDIQNVKQNGLVPVNSALFFKVYAPCEDGFERDAFGICRDVW
ncbi:hypothetical protein evm_007385 [Chilo suppressalis]|nr:hypothetical protein evm_007385 [Chilo suppressalis]